MSAKQKNQAQYFHQSIMVLILMHDEFSRRFVKKITKNVQGKNLRGSVRKNLTLK